MNRITKANIQNQDEISMETEKRDIIPEVEIEIKSEEEVGAKLEVEAEVYLIDLIVVENPVAVAEVVDHEVAVEATVIQDTVIAHASITGTEVDGVVVREVLIDQDPMEDTLIRVPIS